MGFDSGTISFRLFYLPNGLPEDAIERFAADAAPSLAALDSQGITGWVTGHHLLDRDINEDRAYMAGYLHLQLMKAEQKIPDKLLRAEIKMGELVRLRDEGVEYITRTMRSEIKQEVVDRLLPDMPPTLSEIPMVYDEKEQMLYVSALSDKQVEAFALAFRQTVGSDAILMTPESLAMKRKMFNVRDMMPSSYSPDCADEDAGDSLGRDFLTWLWFFVEKQGALIKHERYGDIGIMIEGPLTFVRETGAAGVAVLRKGTVLASAEAKTSLLSGKKLKNAKISIVRGEEVWSCTFDADEFVIRSLKMPKGEAGDATSRFQERMLLLETFRESLLGFFDRYIEVRKDHNAWEKTKAEIQKWVSDKTSIM